MLNKLVVVVVVVVVVYMYACNIIASCFILNFICIIINNDLMTFNS